MSCRIREIVSFLVLFSVLGVSCQKAPSTDAFSPNSNGDYMLDVYSNLDLSNTQFLFQDSGNTISYMKSKGIPLEPLSKKDEEEFFKCLQSINSSVVQEGIFHFDSSDICLGYNDDNIFGEFFHPALHINLGQIAKYIGVEATPSFLPQFNSWSEEYYFCDFTKVGNISLSLIDEKCTIQEVIDSNESVLSSTYFPYMDESVSLFTEKVRIYDIGNGLQIIACYSKAKIDGLFIDSEAGYDVISKDAHLIPITWRCITFYTNSKQPDVYDIYRGINHISDKHPFSPRISLNESLREISHCLDPEQLYLVKSIDLVYWCIPSDFNEEYYQEMDSPIEWNLSYDLKPSWKIKVYDCINDQTYIFLQDVQTGVLQQFREIDVGY